MIYVAYAGGPTRGFDSSLNTSNIAYSGIDNSVMSWTTPIAFNYIARSVKKLNTGKRYFAFVNTSQVSADGCHIGFVKLSAALTYPGADADGYGCQVNRVAGVGTWQGGGFSTLPTAPIVAVGDVAMAAIDFDAGKIWYGRNGTWYNIGDPAAGLSPNQTFTPNSEFYACVSEGYTAVRTAYLSPTAPHSPPSGFSYWDD